MLFFGYIEFNNSDSIFNLSSRIVSADAMRSCSSIDGQYIFACPKSLKYMWGESPYQF